MQKGQTVKIKNPSLTVEDELLSSEAVAILKGAKTTGEVTQVKHDLIYVTFTHNDQRVTQVFLSEELEVL